MRTLSTTSYPSVAYSVPMTMNSGYTKTIQLFASTTDHWLASNFVFLETVPKVAIIISNQWCRRLPPPVQRWWILFGETFNFAFFDEYDEELLLGLGVGRCFQLKFNLFWGWCRCYLSNAIQMLYHLFNCKSSNVHHSSAAKNCQSMHTKVGTAFYIFIKFNFDKTLAKKVLPRKI